MNQTASSSSFSGASLAADQEKPAGGLVSRYRLDHRHPVNHFLHVAVGWPMVAFSILLLPLRPLWSAVLFIGGYAIMFFGHFVFERNTPTILKEPSTPFVIAWSVIRRLSAGIARLARPQRAP